MSNWTPLVEADSIRIPKKTQEMLDSNPTLHEEIEKTKIYLNDKYQVAVRIMGKDDDGGEIIHLSIKRHDKEPCKDWRDFQQIKNQLCGGEAEGVELYPAESRVVDTANQYHLWVFTKSKIGLGFSEGMRSGSKKAAEFEAKQRDE